MKADIQAVAMMATTAAGNALLVVLCAVAWKYFFG